MQKNIYSNTFHVLLTIEKNVGLGFSSIFLITTINHSVVDLAIVSYFTISDM